MAPASLGSERVVNQVVRGAFGARELTFNCVVTVKDGAMTLVGLNSLGVRLFTIRYDGKAVQSETAPALQGPLMPERLLADMQLVFWPLASLAKPMREAGWQLSEPAPGIRRLRHGEQLVAEAHYSGEDPWSGRSWLVNFEFGYSLQIDSQADVAPMTATPALTIAAVLPHVGRMLLLDELRDHGPEHVTCGVTIHAGSMFCDGVHGVPAWVGLEYMAQAAARFPESKKCAPASSRASACCWARAVTRVTPSGSRWAPRCISALICCCATKPIWWRSPAPSMKKDRLLARGDVKAYRPKDVLALIGRITMTESAKNNRSILVTGSSRGIGRAIAERLASSGFQLVLHCRENLAAAEEVRAGHRETPAAWRRASCASTSRTARTAPRQSPRISRPMARTSAWSATPVWRGMAHFRRSPTKTGTRFCARISTASTMCCIRRSCP